MRKVIFYMLTSIDGFYEGPNREIDWHNVDEEYNDFAIDFLDHVDLLLFGRLTYELMAGYWPTEAAKRDDPVVASKMNGLSKIVFSRTLEKAEWENTRLVRSYVPEEVLRIKGEEGKDIAIFGSSDLVVSLIRFNLIDEFRIMVNPIVLGKGKSVFAGIEGRYRLKLKNMRAFESGNVLLYYEPVKG
jgi:dihydrofolate reductase